MTSFKYFIFLAFILLFIHRAQSSLSCYEVIYNLSSLDRCLNTRLQWKADLASKVKNSAQFEKLGKSSDYKCNGTYYSCGYTLSWVSEVFEGLEDQFKEYQNYDDFNGAASGFSLDYEHVLKSFRYMPLNIIFHMRHTGTEDHIFAIEQIPFKGYRIYQSYNDHYSLKAWLSTSLDGLFGADDGEIMLPRKTQARIDQMIRMQTNGSVSLNNLDNLPEPFKPLIPYLEDLRDVNETVVVGRFKKAWEKYGKGQIISSDVFFNEYLPSTKKFVDFYYANDTKSNAITQEVFDKWIELYGAANGFPGYPANFLSQIIFPDRTYRFEIMPKILGWFNDRKCRENANILMRKNEF